MSKTASLSDRASAAPRRLDQFLSRQRDRLMRIRRGSEEQLGECEADLASMTESEGPDEVQFDDESGEGDSTGVARDRDRAIAELAKANIEDVDWALAKMDRGTYGRCEGCGEAIPRARLEALPAVRLCLNCKGNPKGGGLSSLGKRGAGTGSDRIGA